MEDRAQFLQDEVTLAFLDDFMVLPAEPLWCNVYQGLPVAVQRHDEMFAFAH